MIHYVRVLVEAVLFAAVTTTIAVGQPEPLHPHDAIYLTGS